MYQNKSRKIALLGGTTAALIVASTAVAMAISPRKQHALLDVIAHIKQKRQAEFKKALSLTAEQEQQIKEIKSQARHDNEPLMRETVDKYESLVRYLASPDANESVAMSMKKQAIEAQEKMAEVRIHAVFKIKALLDEKQNQKVASLVEDRISEFEANRPEMRQKLEKILSD
ncbi:MAG: Spy/CpxP family protein refolding chaperone [Candidatus Obscuribacterales bacterium]|jgi:Spy/CpxP family protein refolding chaperone|nr:Spy/CpxP family protein refolding chaperone [Candidatus Obscuribacterales bacterium]